MAPLSVFHIDLRCSMAPEPAGEPERLKCLCWIVRRLAHPALGIGVAGGFDKSWAWRKRPRRCRS